MVFWIVLAGLVVLALVALGVVAYGVLGAFGRLGRELAAAERDVAPVLAQARQAADRPTGPRTQRSSGSSAAHGRRAADPRGTPGTRRSAA